MSTLALVCYVILNTSPIEQTCHVEDFETLGHETWIEFCEYREKSSKSLANGFDRFGRDRRLSVCKQYFGNDL